MFKLPTGNQQAQNKTPIINNRQVALNTLTWLPQLANFYWTDRVCTYNWLFYWIIQAARIWQKVPHSLPNSLIVFFAAGDIIIVRQTTFRHDQSIVFRPVALPGPRTYDVLSTNIILSTVAAINHMKSKKLS